MMTASLQRGQDDAQHPLLSVRGLNVTARGSRGIARLVSDVDFDIARGEVFAVIGESGSGKTTAAMAIGDLLASNVAVEGTISLNGQNLRELSPRARRALMGKRISLVSQNALSGLNPSTTVGFQIAEMLMVHNDVSRKDAYGRARELLELVGIPAAAERVHQYPHEFSGGMRQRAMIAMAISLDPDILIADEPTTALDATIKAQILRLLAGLRDRFGMAIMLITHDMGVVARTSDRMMVMYGGRAVETGAVRDCFREPGHPYTRALLAAIPRLDRLSSGLAAIEGAPPSPFSPPPGCAFEPRCPIACDVCWSGPVPALRSASGAEVLCHFPDEKEAASGR